MSDLKTFVKRSNNNTPVNNDRAHAQHLKVTRKTLRTAASTSPRPVVATAPSILYPSTTNGRDQFIDEQYQHAPVTSDGNVFDSTATSGFDDTKSDLRASSPIDLQMRGPMFEGNQSYLQNQHQNYRPAEHFEDNLGDFSETEDTLHHDINMDAYARAEVPALHHKDNRPLPKVDPRQSHSLAPTTTAISGRFYEKQPRPRSTPLAMNTNRQESKKRDRPLDPQASDQNRFAARQQLQAYENQFNNGPSLQEVDDGMDYINQQLEGSQQFGELGDRQGPVLDESPSRLPRSSQVNMSQSITDDRRIPDFKDDELQKMSYSDLKNQEWGANMPSFELPEHIASLDMAEKLFALKDQDEQSLVAFFMLMSDSEWAEAGDIITQTMTNSMNRLQQARAKKRGIVAKYESMYEDHEKTIRGHSNKLDAQLHEMKNSGESVLRGKR